MTNEEYTKEREALIMLNRKSVSELNKRRMAARMYPDGFVVRRTLPYRGEWVEVSGPITKATLVGGTHWDNTEPVELLYYFTVTQPADYEEGRYYQRGEAEGKGEWVWERNLLNGTLLVDRQPPPANEDSAPTV